MDLFRHGVARKLVFLRDYGNGSDVGANVLPEAHQIIKLHALELVVVLDDMVTTECWDQTGTPFPTLQGIIVSMGAEEA